MVSTSTEFTNKFEDDEQTVFIRGNAFLGL